MLYGEFSAENHAFGDKMTTKLNSERKLVWELLIIWSNQGHQRLGVSYNYRTLLCQTLLVSGDQDASDRRL